MAPSSVASLFFSCLLLLLLPAQHDGASSSSHASYKLGSRQIFFKSSQQASTVPPATTCTSPSITTDSNKLPVLHRQSPCSPLHGLPSLTAADVLRRDTSRARQRRFSSQSSSSLVAAPAPAPSPAASIIIPANGSPDEPSMPGTLDYSVVVGYGTPEQQFPVFLDNTAGASALWCKPCASGSDDCGPAFDTSLSSTFTHVPCGSPDCPTTCSSGGSDCQLVDPRTGTVFGTFSLDVLTLAPSSTAVVPDFRFVCLDLQRPPDGLPEAGFLDLSRDRNSLPSRLSSSSASSAFSYCLPQSPSSQGFLSLGGSVGGDGNSATAHAPLVTSNNEGSPDLASMYFIDLVGMSLGGEDLPILAATFGINGTNLDVGTAFTLLPPDAYTPLRDAFRKDMAQYNSNLSPPVGFAGFDTCYNFTGLNELAVPLVRFKFGNGESLLIDGDQMLYFDDPAVAPFTMACLAFSAMDNGDDGAAFSVIGTYQLASMEAVYDVAGGNVGFILDSC